MCVKETRYDVRVRKLKRVYRKIRCPLCTKYNSLKEKQKQQKRKKKQFHCRMGKMKRKIAENSPTAK